MTNPIPSIEDIIPSKAKTWVGLFGSLLTFGVPYIVSAEQYLPAPWPTIVGLVLAVLTALGVYKAPYAPQATVLAPDVPEVHAAAAAAASSTPPPLPKATPDTPAPTSSYQNPWKH